MTQDQIYTAICEHLDQLEIDRLRYIIHETKKRIREKRITKREQARAEWEKSASDDERRLTIHLSVLNTKCFSDFEKWPSGCESPIYHLDDVDKWVVKIAPLPKEEAASLDRETAYLIINEDTKMDRDLILLHELVHFHLGDPDEHCGLAAYPSVAQGFAAFFHSKLSPLIEGNFLELIQEVIAKAGVHPISHSTHSVLFLLKSLDIDYQMGNPPGMVFGYYPELFRNLSFKNQ